MDQRLLPALVVLGLLLPGGPALSHEDQGGQGDHEDGTEHQTWEDDDQSHDRARRASADGEILTIAEILGRIGPQAPGRVLDTELEHEHGRWIYEIKLLDPKGRLYELEIDAHSGQVLRRWEGE